MPIELSSGSTNAEPWKIPEKFDQDHFSGQKLPSDRVVGSLNARAISHQMGNSVQAITITLTAAQLVFCRAGMAGRAVRAAVLAAGVATAVISASLQCATGRGGA